MSRLGPAVGCAEGLLADSLPADDPGLHHVELGLGQGP